MNRRASLVLALVCLLAGGSGTASAQVGAANVVSFRNDLKVPVIIQGVSQVNGQIKRGAPIVVGPGQTKQDLFVPAGVRLYSVFDSSMPGRILVRDVPVPVLPGRPTGRVVRQGQNNQIGLVPE
jgi:hypothetical protein